MLLEDVTIGGVKITSSTVEVLDEATGEKTKKKEYWLKGKYGQVGKPTDNNRLYKESIMRPEFARMEEAMREGAVFGELDHPDDGKIALTRSSHLIKRLEIKPNGEVYGESLIMDTDAGKNLKAIMDAGGKVGVSSRGHGSVVSENGMDVVQDDYVWETFDVVANPAVGDARPMSVMEELMSKKDQGKLTLADLREKFPGLVQEVIEEARADERIKAREESDARDRLVVAESLAAVQAEAYEKAKADLLGDPQVAQAKAVLDRVMEALGAHGVSGDEKEIIEGLQAENAEVKGKFAEAEAEKAEMESLATEATLLAKRAALEIHMERSIGDFDEKDLLREALKLKLDEIDTVEQLDEAISQGEEAIAEATEEEREREGRIEALERDKRHLTGALAEALDAVKELKEGVRKRDAQEEHLTSEEQERVNGLLEALTKGDPTEIRAAIMNDTPSPLYNGVKRHMEEGGHRRRRRPAPRKMKESKTKKRAPREILPGLSMKSVTDITRRIGTKPRQAG